MLQIYMSIILQQAMFKLNECRNTVLCIRNSCWVCVLFLHISVVCMVDFSAMIHTDSFLCPHYARLTKDAVTKNGQ